MLRKRPASRSSRRRHLRPLAEIAETAAIFGDDWQPHGLEPNLKMLTDFCQDQCAQKLVDLPVDPVVAFADYTRFTW